MLFHSPEFLLFMIALIFIYWVILKGNRRGQNWMLLLASYMFYGAWNWRFLILIFISSICDYYIALRMNDEENRKKRKGWLFLSLGINLGILGFFKYFNFFISSFAELLQLIGFQANIPTLNIILPIGISFYTFQTLSYTIDVYRGQMKPTRDWLSFFVFVSFFPQLVAGPIERAKSMIPQFTADRSFDQGQFISGLKFILYGLFKKIVFADSCGVIVNEVYGNPGAYSGSTLIVATILFTIQVYCDFSGYSDMAIGLGKLFGFQLMRNFAYPFFTRTFPEFYARWHMSLMNWFRDYVYIPLGGNRKSSSRTKLNVMIVFFISGLWHGANWTYIFWGLISGFFFLLHYTKYRSFRKHGFSYWNQSFPKWSYLQDMLINFSMMAFSLIFFRAVSIGDAFTVIRNIFSFSTFAVPLHAAHLIYPVVLFVWEWHSRKHWHGLAMENQERWYRWAVYLVVCVSIMYHYGQNQEFIYYQF